MAKKRKKRHLGAPADEHIETLPQGLHTMQEAIATANKLLSNGECFGAVGLYGYASRWAGTLQAHIHASIGYPVRYKEETEKYKELLNKSHNEYVTAKRDLDKLEVKIKNACKYKK